MMEDCMGWEEMDGDEVGYILYEMYGVDNDGDLESAIEDCWNNLE